MEDHTISYDTDKKVEDDSLDFKFDESFKEEEILDLVDIAEKGDEPQDQVSDEAVLTSAEEAVDDITISEDDLAIDSDELSLNLEEDAPEGIDAEIETALEGLDESSGTNEAVEEEKVELSGLSGEKVEELIKKTVEDVVERVVRETMVTVSEKVIKEAIDALKQTLESFEDRG